MEEKQRKDHTTFGYAIRGTPSVSWGPSGEQLQILIVFSSKCSLGLFSDQLLKFDLF